MKRIKIEEPASVERKPEVRKRPEWITPNTIMPEGLSGEEIWSLSSKRPVYFSRESSRLVREYLFGKKTERRQAVLTFAKFIDGRYYTRASGKGGRMAHICDRCGDSVDRQKGEYVRRPDITVYSVLNPVFYHGIGDLCEKCSEVFVAEIREAFSASDSVQKVFKKFKVRERRGSGEFIEP